MKILLVQETDWIDKGPFQQNHLMERLSLRGHEIRVIDHQINWSMGNQKGLWIPRQIFNNFSKIYAGAKVDVIRPGMLKIPHLDYVSLFISRRREVFQQIQIFKPDVVIGFHILSAYLGMIAAKKTFLPFIYYWVDVYHTQIPFKLYHLLGKYIEKKTLRESDKVVAINERLKDYIVQMGTDPQKTSVIRGSVDTTKFNLSLDGSNIRKQFGIKNGEILLFFVGWIYHFSGLKEIARQLSGVDSNLKLLIVGDGDAYQDLLEMREKYDLQDKVILTGKKPYQEVPQFIAAADICLLPADPAEKIMQDIVPIKLYEYMAMAKPVISTNLPGVRKEFGEDNGVVYVERPEEVVPRAIELVQSGRLPELGQKARRFVEQNSWDKITDEFESLLEEVISEKRRTF